MVDQSGLSKWKSFFDLLNELDMNRFFLLFQKIILFRHRAEDKNTKFHKFPDRRLKLMLITFQLLSQTWQP